MILETGDLDKSRRRDWSRKRSSEVEERGERRTRNTQDKKVKPLDRGGD